MVNPYYFLFYLFFKFLDPIAKEKDRVPFTIVAFIGLGIIIHSVILLIVIKTYFDIEILPKMNKLLFGLIFAGIFFFINNYLFERNNRYLEIIGKIKQEKMYKKINALLIVLLYLSLPISIIVLF